MGKCTWETACRRRKLTLDGSIVNILQERSPAIAQMLRGGSRVLYSAAILRRGMSDLQLYRNMDVRSVRIETPAGSITDIDVRDAAEELSKLFHYAMSRRKDIYMKFEDWLYR